MTENDVLWLIAKGHIVVLPKVRDAGKPVPQRVKSVALRMISKRSRVMLTEQGIAFASAIRNPSVSVPAQPNQSASIGSPPGSPWWDRAKRVLWVGSRLVKRFNVPAANQELILAVFAEEGWPECIDDPLPQTSEIDSKERLHDTIKRLNRGHECRLIRFHGNGNGLAVHWEPISLPASTRPRSTLDRP